MNVSAVSDLAQRSQDFAALQNNLQSGNITSAQRAFAAFLQDVQKTSVGAGSGNLFAPGTPASRDLQTLGSALKSANLNGAQQAFAALQQDIHAQGQTGPAPTPAPGHHPPTHAEIARNGAPAFQPTAKAAQQVLSTLSTKV
jgi:hypothetical protein